jgi:hypothetical protein
MAVASLTNFTVPLAAGGASQTSQGLLMPKLKYRFRLSFVNFGVSTANVVELTKQVQDAKRPSVKFNPVTVDIYNSKVYFQGKPEWDETTVNLRDDANGAVSQLVGEQIQKQFDFNEQASASTGIDYKFQLQIDILDGGNGAITPNVLESWALYGCFLSSVDYGELNYNSSDPQTIALSIRFDNAEQLPAGGQTAGVGLGTAIGKGITGATITG